MITIAVIEDEKAIQEDVVMNIENITHTFEDVIIDCYDDAESYLHANKRYHVVVSDIELPGMNGLDLGKKIREDNPEVYLIFLTSYTEFATESYVIEAYQYILKKDMEGRLPALIQKIVLQIQKEMSEWRWVGNHRDRKKLYFKDIVYIRKLKGSKYSEYVTTEGICTERLPLNQIVEELNNSIFIVADRGHVLNMNHITRIHGNTIYMDQGDEVIVSRVQLNQVKKMLTEYWRRSR